MPGKVKVKVMAGKNLPVMDRSNDTTDAYVEVKLGNVTYKTDVCRKSLNPQWNSEWFRFEMDDLELQDEPLQIRLMDYDTYSANDSIGKVYIDLNPLLTNPSKTKEPSGRSMSGWIPVYDTMHGIRGEVNLMVKVELFSDLNKFRQSSCGVKFFFSPNIPEGHIAIQLHGFVEELVVNDDPEYQWIDKIRTPRASNEARQTLFSKLSGEVQRRVGLKALELGGNAVIGYRQCFDLEGESGIVVRGIGTATTLTKVYDTQISPLAERADGTSFGLTGTVGAAVQAHGDNSSLPLSTTLPTMVTPHATICSEPIPEEQSASSTENSVSDGYNANAEPATSQVHAYDPKAEMGISVIDLPEVAISQKSNSTATALVSLVSHSIDLGSSNTLTASVSQTPVKHTVPSATKSGGRTPVKPLTSPNPPNLGSMGRRSSESDLSTPPKGLLNSSIQAMLASSHGKGPSFAPSRRPAAGADHFDMLEYPFITISQLPPRFIQRIGGSVSARSVKLLERISNLDEPESRDSWWTELRMEIRSHARSICCNVILGYEEHTTICDDVCVLSATGTAAIVNSAVLGDISEGPSASKYPVPSAELKNNGTQASRGSENSSGQQNGVRASSLTGPHLKLHYEEELDCSLCHIPYSENGVPFPVKMARCSVCKKGRVPDLLLSTVDIPPNIPICGKTCIIQAQVFRPKRDCKGESSAREVSDSLPFLEYELHRRLINKLKVKGMNAIFCLNVQICLGENLMMAIATGTALCLAGLPTPELPKITAGNLKTDTQKVGQFQKVVQDVFDRNREYYQLTSHGSGQNNGGSESSDEDADDGLPEVDLATGNKDTYVLEVDDSEDIEIISELIEPSPSLGFEMSTLDRLLGYDDFTVTKQQMFSHIWRCRIPGLTLRQLATNFETILRSISFKLRSMKPCVINKIHFRLELPEEDEMQLSITGTALGLREKVKSFQDFAGDSKASPLAKGTRDDSEMIFSLECDGNSNPLEPGSGGGSNYNPSSSFSIPAATASPSSPSSVATRTADATSTSPAASALAPLTTPPSQVRNSTNRASGTIAIPPATIATPSPSNAASARALASLSSSPLPPKNSVSPHQPPNSLLNILPPPTPSFPVCSIPPLQRSRSISSQTYVGNKARVLVEMTTLSHIPGQRIEKYLGNLNFFFIRETTSIKEMGGPTGFVHNFVMEVTAILRGHVSALGGNALVSYFMTELSLLYNPHKNQGQCLISVGGDAVLSLPPKPILTPAGPTEDS